MVLPSRLAVVSCHITFGTFVLDDDQHALFEGSREVHLSLKAYDLLKLLVVERPRALSKAEIHERLWPDTFVSDAALTTVVAELREMLGEHDRQGPFIKTIHGFGYAFAGRATDIRQTTQREAGETLSWLEYGRRRFKLDLGEHLIGREAGVTVCLDDPTVSRHHARLVVTPAGVSVEDLSSRNGTRVSGQRVDTLVPLHDGDELGVGSVILVFRSLIEPGSTVEQPLSQTHDP